MVFHEANGPVPRREIRSVLAILYLDVARQNRLHVPSVLPVHMYFD